MQFSKKVVLSLRDAVSFKSRLCTEHFHATHIEKEGALESVPNFNMVNGLPPDIMHGGDLGVVLKSLNKILTKRQNQK